MGRTADYALVEYLMGRSAYIVLSGAFLTGYFHTLSVNLD